MTIKIVVDSACDLPDTIIAKYNLTIVPLYINIDHQSYLDGVDISRETFYQHLSNGDSLPTTAAPGAETFRQIYERLAAEGATEILSIHVASTVSATLNHARLGAQETNEVRVTVFDSRQISLGLGFLAVTAAKAVATGRSIKDILPILEAQILRTHLLGVLDTLEFLRRSGRAGRIMTSLGSLLQIKPLFKLYNGEIMSERIRTRQRAIKRLTHILGNLTPFEQIALIHSHAPERTEALRKQIWPLLPEHEILQVEITPILGAHLGPGGIGVVCVTIC